MGSLSKLWVIIEQVNSVSGSSGTVEMDTVLELLEKTVFWIGQCNNTITYERRRKFRSNYNGKYILFQKKGGPSQQQPNFTSSYDKHGGIDACSSNSKKNFFPTKNSKMCPSREGKGISSSLEITDKRSKALSFSRRLPNSSSNGTSIGEGPKSTKVKSGTTKASRSGSEGNAVEGLHFKSLSLKRGIFEQFFSDQ